MFSINSGLNRFAILLCCSDDARTFRIVAYLIDQGAPVIKWTTLLEEKKVLGQKTSKKMGFLGFSHTTALNRFAILLCCSDDARTSRIVAYWIDQGAPVIKWTTLSEEKKFWAKKLQKMGFLGFSNNSTQNCFPILLCCSDDARTSRMVI